MNEADRPPDIEPEVAPPPPSKRWARIDTVALILIVLVAGGIRLAGLSSPDTLVFDETYYAKDACFYVYSSETVCDTANEITGVHPPLGKWLLAIGVEVFGYDSFGWRIGAAIGGIFSIALLYLLAKRLLGTFGAILAAGLLATDLLHFVQSRVAMLDIFVPMFGLAALLFVVYDRDHQDDRVATAPPPPETDDENMTAVTIPRLPVWRPWLAAAGVMAGAATASKWSGAVFPVLVLALAIVWGVRRHRMRSPVTDRKEPGTFGRFLTAEGWAVVLWLVILPLVAYGATYIGRLDGTLLAAPWSDGSWFRALWEQQRSMADFHLGLEATHSYQSPAWSWILLKRPVSYFFETGDNGDYREIFAAGSPFVWWSSMLAMGYVAYRWVVGRIERGPEGLILAGFAFTYLPWLALGFFSPRSAVFLFYLLPTIPFMTLALAYAATRLGSTWEAKAAVGLFAAGAIGLFAFYYPLTAAVGIPQSSWQKRIWVFDSCDKPPAREVTTSVTETKDDATIIRTSVTTSDESVPPTGWCWI